MPEKRLLVSIPQSPFDVASGAAISARSTAWLAARAGWLVRVLGTTACEGAAAVNSPRPDSPNPSYRILDTGAARHTEVNRLHGDALDAAFDEELAAFRPDLLLTYGGSAREAARRQRAREQGCRVVFTLHNLEYRHPAAFAHVDSIRAPSRFLAERYAGVTDVPVTVLPVPIIASEIVAPRREPGFFTFVNPSLHKGGAVFARIADEVARLRPGIPFLVIESRGTARLLHQVARASGCDLSRHPSIFASAPLPDPSKIWAVTKVLLVPSIVEEAAGRVVAEAACNGIPSLVSNRGGLAETLDGGGLVLPVDPAWLRELPPAAEVEPWVRAILRLASDGEFYAGLCEQARRSGAKYDEQILGQAYAQFFDTVLGR